MRGQAQTGIACRGCGSPHAQGDGLCPRCRVTEFGRARRRYHWTPELLSELRAAYRQNKAHVSAALDRLERKTGWPRHAFLEEARVHGWQDTGRTRPWLADEEVYLRERLGTDSTRLIAGRLHRSVRSIQTKANAMRLSARLRDGYTSADLQQVFGASHRTVRHWIERGWLGRVRDGRVTEASVKAFLLAHPSEYSLRATDEVWFKGMVCGGLEAWL